MWPVLLVVACLLQRSVHMVGVFVCPAGRLPGFPRPVLVLVLRTRWAHARGYREETKITKPLQSRAARMVFFVLACGVPLGALALLLPDRELARLARLYPLRTRLLGPASSTRSCLPRPARIRPAAPPLR